MRIGGEVHPEAMQVRMPRVEPRVKRLVSWPGFFIVVGRYEPRKGK